MRLLDARLAGYLKLFRVFVRPLLGLSADRAMVAAKSGDVAKLRRFVWLGDYEILRGEHNGSNLTPLHWACAENHASAVEFLLSSKIGCNPNISKLNGFTPLHAAAANGHAEMCTLLIGLGANVNNQTIPQRYSPLHSAAFIGDIHTLEVLLKSGADTSLCNYRDERPTDTAARQGHEEAAMLIARLSERQGAVN